MSPTVIRKPAGDRSLQYRWGIVGVVAAFVLFVWFLQTTGIIKHHTETRENPNVKILCPRCGGDSEKQPNCSLCAGKGYLWVDKTKYLPGEIIPIE